MEIQLRKNWRYAAQLFVRQNGILFSSCFLLALRIEPHDETLVETGGTHHPIRTLTRTPWGDQWFDAVACEGSTLIRPARMLCLEGL